MSDDVMDVYHNQDWVSRSPGVNSETTTSRAPTPYSPVLLRYFLVHHSTPIPLLSNVPTRGTK
ncbi:MAG: hypothetical protein ACJ8BW_13195, partial [Ktedonobacteraceae bacterium]